MITEDLDKDILTKINFIISTLEKNEHHAFLVGGCVRDLLLGLSPSDFDIASSAKAEEIKTIFSNYKTVDTGLKYGTVTLIIDKIPFEITTFRKNEKYCNFRQPEKLEFSNNIEDDLTRRDFTINAIAFHPDGKILDPFFGQKDLKNKIIRCVGNPDKRFEEDALRILRALRFSSVLDFEIEEDTKNSILKNKELLLKISKERITSEIKKLICGKAATKIIKDYFEVFCVLFPKLRETENFIPRSSHHNESILNHCLKVMDNLPKTVEFRLTGLFHDISKPNLKRNHSKNSRKIAYDILTEYKFDNKTKYKICDLIECHDYIIPKDEVLLNKFIKDLGVELFISLLTFRRADILGQRKEFYYRLEDLSQIEEISKKIIKSSVLKISDLNIDGNDLKALKIPDKKIGYYLDLLLNAVIEHRVENEKPKLIKYLSDQNKK